MFLSPNPIVAETNWRDIIQRGDVVLFRFPVNKRGRRAQPKRRPCLVLDIRTIDGTKFLDLAYGTSSDTKANKGYEIRIRQIASYLAAGLDRPTRFVCARRITVSVNHPGFNEEGKPRTLIGRLDPPLMERMNALCALLQVKADDAAKLRKNRRAEQVRGEHEACGFR